MSNEELKAAIQDIHDNVYQQGKEDTIDECNKKLDELERKYKSCYGAEIIEMYADVYEEFRAWLKEQNK